MPKSKSNSGQTGTTNGMDRTVSLLGSAVKNLKVITDSIDNIGKTVDRRKKTDTDNAVRVSKAETDSKKEDNRHGEAMAKIELEYRKVSEASASGNLKWSMVQEMIKMIKDEADKLNNMDDVVYLSEEANMSRENLHKTMLELAKEIIRSRSII